jgi:hypothetical protein
MHKLGVGVAALMGLAGLCCGAAAASGYRFQAPGVVDISVDDGLAPLAKGDPIAPTPLAADAAAAILKAPEAGNDAPGQLPMLDGDDKAARKQEGARLAAAAPAVSRAGKTLTLKPQAGAAVTFTDQQPPKRKDADEDGELFVYAGPVGAGYHRIEERFQQDAPGSYLVNGANGKTIFTPNGSYVVQLSPDGKWLLSMSPGDTHVLLAVMALDADGPNLALYCRGSGNGNAGPAAFKGWHDATSFDLVLSPIAPGQQKASENIPVRFSLQGQSWRPATPDPKVFDRLGYVCRL